MLNRLQENRTGGPKYPSVPQLVAEQEQTKQAQRESTVVHPAGAPIGHATINDVEQAATVRSREAGIDPDSARLLELARLRESGVSAIDGTPINDLIAAGGGDEQVATAATLETVRRLNKRLGKIDGLLGDTQDARKAGQLSAERDILLKVLEKKQGLIDAIPTEQRIKSALGSVLAGLTEIPAAVLDFTAISAKKIDEVLPAAMRDYESQEVSDLASAQLAQRIREAMQGLAPSDPALADEFWFGRVPNAIGSMLAFIGATLATKSPVITPLVLGATTGGAQGYKEAIAAGADEQTAMYSFLLNAGVGTTEIIPIARMFNRLNRVSGGGFKRALMDAGIEGLEEFVQEFGQQTAGNFIAQQLYDENRGLFDESLPNGNAGGVSGILASLLVTAVGHGKARLRGVATNQPTQPEGGDNNGGKEVQGEGEGPQGPVLTPPNGQQPSNEGQGPTNVPSPQGPDSPPGTAGTPDGQPTPTDSPPAPGQPTGPAEEPPPMKAFEVEFESGEKRRILAPSVGAASKQLPDDLGKVKAFREVDMTDEERKAATPVPTTPPPPSSTATPGQPPPDQPPPAAPDEKKPQHEKSSTQVTLPPEAAKPFVDYGASIPEADLYTDPKDASYGRETEPHITALYGIENDDVEPVRQALAGIGPVTAKLGKVSAFENADRPYDVLKIDIDSADLHRVNAALKAGTKFSSDFPDYKPHLTLAYVKKGMAKKYVGDERFAGKELTFDTLQFRTRDGRSIDIKLGGPAGTQTTPSPEGSGVGPSGKGSGEAGPPSTSPAPGAPQGKPTEEPKPGSQEPGTDVPAPPATPAPATPEPGAGTPPPSGKVNPGAPAPEGKPPAGPGKVSPKPKSKAGLTPQEDQDIRDAFKDLDLLRGPEIAKLEKPGAIAQKGLPSAKRAAFLDLAEKLAPKIKTPEDLARELDRVLDKKARPYSQAVWNAFATIEPDRTGMHDWGAIYAKLDAEATEPPPEETKPPAKPPLIPPSNRTEREQIVDIAKVVHVRLMNAVEGRMGPFTRADLKQMTSASSLSEKLIDEAAELGVVLAAREIAQGKRSNEDKFDRMVKLYEAQPNLTSKTSTSKINQAYSTPPPMAWFASLMTPATAEETVVDSTGGNGALLVDRKGGNGQTLANEIDPVRRANLEHQGLSVLGYDATSDEWEHFLSGYKPKVMRLNPPFGVVKDEGTSREFPLPNPDNPKLTTTNIDQAITLGNLQYLDPNGRAVLIIGSGGGKAMNADERQKAYMQGIKQSYFYYLYRGYNVVEHLTLSGDLYQKQGAGWPVDIIVIDGRGKSALPFPWIESPPWVSSWNELRNRIGQRRSTGQTEQPGAGAPVPEPGNAGPAPGGGVSPQPGQPGAGGGNHGGGSSGGTVSPPGHGGTGTGGPTGPGSSTGESGVPGQPGGETGGSVPSNPDVPESGSRPIEVLEGGFQAKYTPASKSPQNVPALTPTNLVTPQERALKALELRRGPIDVFVRTELGYKSDAELHKVFDGTQIDALGLAIDNVLRGGALINTDQTGMGKGRTAAAMLRYAVRRGKVPIFVTDNKGLYADMMRDLDDIGSGELVPMMTDNNELIRYEDNNGKLVRELRTPIKSINEKGMLEAMEQGRLPKGVNIIFTTYNQLSSDVATGFKEDKKEKDKRERKRIARPDGNRLKFIRHFAKDGMLVMDESHNAGGASDTGWRMQQMLFGFNATWQFGGKKAMPFGVTYLSATYAKRPANMGVYFATDVKRAVQSPAQLQWIMQRGGVPLQQVLSAMLAENGQLIRREMDFTGVNFPTVYTTQREDGTIDETQVARETKLADSFTEPIREMLELNNSIGGLMAVLQAQFAQQGIKTAEGKLVQHHLMKADFGAQIHNMVNQYVLAIKAPAIADRAIAELKKGHSPVVAIYNTMESVSKDLKANDLPRNFNGLLHRYLLKALKVRLKNPDGSTREVTIDLDNLEATFPELEKIPEGAYKLAAMLARQRNVIKELIDETDRSGLPLSPIDAIKYRIEDAGFKLNEISGRKEFLTRKGDFDGRPKLHATKRGHNQLLKDFNSQTKVALLLTSSGTTGISAHASSKFRNKQQRVMLVGQVQPDINDMMQMFGRVFRKGQVSKPEYAIVNTSIPAENRLSAVLSKNLNSLNANTTSAQKGVTTEAGGIDFINGYGDEVVYRFLLEHPEMVAAMRRNFPHGALPEIDPDSPEGMQELERMGMGTGDFSRRVSGELAILSVADQTTFYDHVLREYQAKIEHLTAIGENELLAESMPLGAETIERRIIFQGRGDTVFDSAAYLETVRVRSTRKPLDPAEIEPLGAEGAKKARKIINDFSQQADVAAEKRMQQVEKKHGASPDWPDIRQRHLMGIRNAIARIRRGLSLVGRPVIYAFQDGTNAIGMVTDVKFDPEQPLTPSAHKIEIHLNTERIKIEVPMSMIERIVEFQGYDWKENYRNLMNLAAKRLIITGNLLAGYSAAERLLSAKGGRPRVITYTTKNGEILQGVLMPSTFNPKDTIIDVKKGEELVAALKEGQAVTSLGGAEFYWKDDAIELRVPASKSAGGRYWQDQRLLALVRGVEMKQKGAQMVGVIDVDNAGNVVTFFNETIEDPLSYMKGSKGRNTGPAVEISPEQDALDKAVDKQNATDALQICIDRGLFDKNPAIKKLAEWAVKFRVKMPVHVFETWQHPALDQYTGGFHQDSGIAGFYQDEKSTDKLGEGDLDWRSFTGIGLHRGYWNNPKVWDAGPVMLHEYLHALTVKFIRANPGAKPVKLLNQLAQYSYELAKKRGDESHTEYGYFSVRNRDDPSIEFVTELFANPKFQKILSEQEAPGWAITERVKTMWEAFVNAIRNILGLPPQTIFEESMRTSTELVQQAHDAPPAAEPMFAGLIQALSLQPHAKSATDTQQQILNRVTGTLEDKRTVRQRLKDLVADTRDYIDTELRQKLVDRFNSIRRLEKAAFGNATIDASASAYKWARLTANLPSVMEHMLKYGPIEYRAGSMLRRTAKMVYEDGAGAMEEFDPRGLVEILAPLERSGKVRLWEGYVAAYRANGLLKEKREKNFGWSRDPATGAMVWSKGEAQRQINELLDLGAQNPEFEKIRREYIAFQRTVLDVAEAAGVVSPTQRALWERSDYVPFYRIMDTMDSRDAKASRGPYKRRGIANQRSGIRRLKGGENAVAVLENIYRNVETLIDASFKNLAMQRVADLAGLQNDLITPIPYQAVPFRVTVEEAKKAMEREGVNTSGLSDEDLQTIIAFWRMRAPQGKDVVSVMINGKAKYYRVKDAPLLRSILALGPDRHALWMRLLTGPKKVLTSFVTLDPAFMVANTMRDSLSTWVIADSPIKPGLDAARGLLKSLRNDPSKLEIMAAGGGSGHYNRLSAGEVRKTFLRMTPRERGDFLGSIVDSPAKVWRMYKDVGRATENANRVALYDSARAHGASEAEAAFQALDIMDFGLRGDSRLLNFFLDTVPFLNARIQGLYRLGRGFRHNKGRVATHGALVTGATLALLALNWDNDDYWSLQEWDRDQYYHLWLGGKHYRIPKPFEVGQIFSTVSERIVEVLGKTGDTGIFAERMLSMVRDTFAFNPIPQAFKPVAERAMNLNLFTGTPIISQGDQYKSPEQQYSMLTSETMRGVAEAMPDVAPSWLRSPKTLEHFLRGYLGTLGIQTLNAADAITRELGNYPEAPASKTSDFWLVGRFAPDEEGKATKYVGQFYDLHREISELRLKAKELRERGDLAEAATLEAENRDLMAYAPRTDSTYKNLADIRKRQTAIYAGNLPGSVKRERLDALTEQRNDLARRSVEASPRRSRPFNPFASN